MIMGRSSITEKSAVLLCSFCLLPADCLTVIRTLVSEIKPARQTYYNKGQVLAGIMKK